jgi:hypothetical protein
MMEKCATPKGIELKPQLRCALFVSICQLINSKLHNFIHFNAILFFEWPEKFPCLTLESR